MDLHSIVYVAATQLLGDMLRDKRVSDGFISGGAALNAAASELGLNYVRPKAVKGVHQDVDVVIAATPKLRLWFKSTGKYDLQDKVTKLFGGVVAVEYEALSAESYQPGEGGIKFVHRLKVCVHGANTHVDFIEVVVKEKDDFEDGVFATFDVNMCEVGVRVGGEIIFSDKFHTGLERKQIIARVKYVTIKSYTINLSGPGLKTLERQNKYAKRLPGFTLVQELSKVEKTKKEKSAESDFEY